MTLQVTKDELWALEDMIQNKFSWGDLTDLEKSVLIELQRKVKELLDPIRWNE